MSELAATDSEMAGVAGRISAAEKGSIAMHAEPAVVRATIHITRAATGQVETFDLVGTLDPQEPPCQ